MSLHLGAQSELSTDFRFTQDEKGEALEVLGSCTISPYHNYAEFSRSVLLLSELLPKRFIDFVGQVALRDFSVEPITVLENCPIDESLPVFGNEDPRKDKLALKRTFVAEGLLAIYALISRTQTIAHLSVNDGDFFHDIYPKTSMFELQSAKTLKTLKFHKDFPTHFVTPDFINTLTMRDTPNNEVYSTFAINSEALGLLGPDDIYILLESRFTTPVDDSSGSSKIKIVNPVGVHPIIDQNGMGFKLFEGRTHGIDKESEEVLARLVVALHKVKRIRISQVGELVSFCNRYVIHGREVVNIDDPEELTRRWLIKSHTVYNISGYERFYLKDRYGVVDG